MSDGGSLTFGDFTTDLLDEEPRIAAWRLAQALGLVRDTNIRQLIERYRHRLERWGTLHQSSAKSSGGRPGIEYGLNFKQAIFIIVKSDAPNADAVQDHVIEIYALWAQGKLNPVDAETEAKVEAATADLKQAAPELLDALRNEIRDCGDRNKKEIIEQIIGALDEKIVRAGLRRYLSKEDYEIQKRVIMEDYHGYDPSGSGVRLFDDVGNNIGNAVQDHWTGNPLRNGIDEMWITTQPVNQAFENNRFLRLEKIHEWNLFQKRVADMVEKLNPTIPGFKARRGTWTVAPTSTRHFAAMSIASATCTKTATR